MKPINWQHRCLVAEAILAAVRPQLEPAKLPHGLAGHLPAPRPLTHAQARLLGGWLSWRGRRNI